MHTLRTPLVPGPKLMARDPHALRRQLNTKLGVGDSLPYLMMHRCSHPVPAAPTPLPPDNPPLPLPARLLPPSTLYTLRHRHHNESRTKTQPAGCANLASRSESSQGAFVSAQAIGVIQLATTTRNSY